MRSVPRLRALHILTDVLSNRKPLDEAIEAHCNPVTNLGGPSSSSDRAWLTEVTSGVVRNLRRIDATIDAYALKKKPSGKIRKILQIAAYQLLHQDRVFPATVVSETVDLIKSEEGEAPSRFANALLRKISDSRADWLELPAPGIKATLYEKSAWANLPDWWWQKWEKTYGFEEAKQIAVSSLERPEIWFRLKDEKKIPDFLTSGPVSGSAKQKERNADSEEVDFDREIRTLPGFKEGEWIIQDLASQILVSRFAALLKKEIGKKGKPIRILDRCAAPGGKTIALNWLGLEVVATDPSEPRRKLLESAVARAAPQVTIITDGHIKDAGPYDGVWIDAPCSGSGILRRHPDVRWLRKESDLANLTGVQRRLIREALALIPSGGIVIYTVCSLFEEEGKAHLSEFTESATVLDEVLLSPHQTPSTDGFYGVVLRKK